MAEPFQLKLTLNMKDFRSGIASVKASLTGFVGDVKGVFGGIAGGLNVLANGVHIVRGAIDGLRAAFGVLTQFSEQGQQLEEGGSKFEAVFKEVTASADAFAKKLANDVGRSVVQVKNSLADTQGVLAGFGFDRAKAAEISQTLIQLGIDLASFNNATDEEAFGALRSGLLGEAEALKKFGVALTETAVQQQAFQLGFDPSNLTEQEKVLTRLAIITKQTADAQGDAIRTSDSFANQMKRLNGALFDLAASIGDGINQALKPAVSGINEFLTNNKAEILSAVDGLRAAIKNGLESVFTGLGGTAERAGRSVINIFNELPASLDAGIQSLGKMKDFALRLFDILTGGASKSNAAINESTSIFERFEQALAAPGVIVALANIRIAVAAVTSGLAALYQFGRLVFSGIEAFIGSSLMPLQALLDGLGAISDRAQEAADQLQSFIDNRLDDAGSRAEEANELIGQIADNYTNELDSAKFDIENAQDLGKQIREQAKQRRDAAKAEREVAEAAKKTLEAEEAKAREILKSSGNFKEQKAQQEAIKKATEETKRVEEQIADARARATETLQDDLALIRERIAAEVRAAQAAKASAEEIAQIKKRGLLQETALIEEAQRRQAEATKKRIEEDKKAAASLRDFLTGADRGRRRDQGLNLGADAEESLERVGAQKGNIRTAADRDALINEITATQQSNLDKRTEALRRMSESIGDIRRALDDARANGDYEGAAAAQEDLRQKQAEYTRVLREANDAGKRDAATASRLIDEVKQSYDEVLKSQAESNAKAFETAQLTPSGSLGDSTSTTAGASAAAATTQSPVNSAVETLRGVIEGANSALKSGLDSLATGIGNLATAAQELVNTSTTVFPQALTSLDSVLSSQQELNTQLNTFGSQITTKLGEHAVAITKATQILADHGKAIEQIKLGQNGVMDARTGGL